MKQRKKPIQRWVGLALAVVLLAGLTLSLVGAGRAAPENPLQAQKTEPLEQETLAGTVGGLTSAEQAELELEREEQEQPQQQEEDPQPEEQPETVIQQPTPSDNSKPQPGGNTTPGNGDGENPDPDPAPVPGEPDIVTDLANGTVYESDLTDDILPFYARAINAGSKAYVQVKLKNKDTNNRFRTLESDRKGNFKATLSFGSNEFRMYLMKDGKSLMERTVTVTYEVQHAGPDNPNMGDAPKIVTNLDDAITSQGGCHDEKNNAFDFKVTVTAADGHYIQNNFITVQLTDTETGTTTEIREYTGKDTYNYALSFTPPNIGDEKLYYVTVLAVDDQNGKNSAWQRYSIRYLSTAQGDVTGQATVILDATTVGLDVMDTITVDVKAGDTAADVVEAALDSYGYSVEASRGGSYYLSRIYRSGSFDGSIPDTLAQILETDGFVIQPTYNSDSLGDRDYTSGSGWLCYMNGVGITQSMGAEVVSAGSTIQMRFTLAYGKDVGSSSRQGGQFDHYCYSWVGGYVSERDHLKQTETRVEPTETADGWVGYYCARCGKQIVEQVLPATGPVNPDPNPTPDPDPTPDPEPNPPENPDPAPETESESGLTGLLRAALTRQADLNLQKEMRLQLLEKTENFGQRIGGRPLYFLRAAARLGRL